MKVDIKNAQKNVHECTEKCAMNKICVNFVPKSIFVSSPKNGDFSISKILKQFQKGGYIAVTYNLGSLHIRTGIGKRMMR